MISSPKRFFQRWNNSTGSASPAETQSRTDEMLAVNDALDRLAEEAPHAAALVKLRYFAGMSLREAADALGIARSTADLHWTYAKSYLYCELKDWKNG